MNNRWADKIEENIHSIVGRLGLSETLSSLSLSSVSVTSSSPSVSSSLDATAVIDSGLRAPGRLLPVRSFDLRRTLRVTLGTRSACSAPRATRLFSRYSGIEDDGRGESLLSVWRDSLRLLKGSENFDSRSASGSVRAVDGAEFLRRPGTEEVEETGEVGGEDWIVGTTPPEERWVEATCVLYA